MTTPEERWQEFLDECVTVDDPHPGATRIDWGPARRREAVRVRIQLEYQAWRDWGYRRLDDLTSTSPSRARYTDTPFYP